MSTSQSAPASALLRFSAVCAALFGALLFFGYGALVWLLRDGLGPDSVESTGWQALLRFVQGFWVAALLALLLFIVAYALARRATKLTDTTRNA